MSSVHVVELPRYELDFSPSGFSPVFHDLGVSSLSGLVSWRVLVSRSVVGGLDGVFWVDDVARGVNGEIVRAPVLRFSVFENGGWVGVDAVGLPSVFSGSVSGVTGVSLGSDDNGEPVFLVCYEDRGVFYFIDDGVWVERVFGGVSSGVFIPGEGWVLLRGGELLHLSVELEVVWSGAVSGVERVEAGFTRGGEVVVWFSVPKLLVLSDKEIIVGGNGFSLMSRGEFVSSPAREWGFSKVFTGGGVSNLAVEGGEFLVFEDGVVCWDWRLVGGGREYDFYSLVRNPSGCGDAIRGSWILSDSNFALIVEGGEVSWFSFAANLDALVGVFNPAVSWRAGRSLRYELVVVPGPARFASSSVFTDVNDLFAVPYVVFIDSENVLRLGNFRGELLDFPGHPLIGSVLPVNARHVTAAFDQYGFLSVAFEVSNEIFVHYFNAHLEAWEVAVVPGVDPVLVLDSLWTGYVGVSDVTLFFLPVDRSGGVRFSVQWDFYSVFEDVVGTSGVGVLDGVQGVAGRRFQLLVGASNGDYLPGFVSSAYPELVGGW